MEPKIPEIDPFDRLSNSSIDLYLLKQVIEENNKNGSVLFCRDIRSYCGVFPYITISNNEYLAINGHPIFIKFKGYKFLTCYREEFLSF
jgi:hypothetical protein